MLKKFLPHIVAFLFLAGFVAYAWTEPASVPPDGNVAAPINVSGNDQTFLDTKTLWMKSDETGAMNLNGAFNVKGVSQFLNDAIFDKDVCIGGVCESAWPAEGLGGSGIVNYVSKFTGASSLGNSSIFDNGTNIGIGTASPGAKLDVQGDIKATSLINSGGVSFPASGCSASNRGQQWLLQGGAGIEDGFYICKKKADGSYSWYALGSPQLVAIWENAFYLVSGISQTVSFSVPNDAKKIVCAGNAYQTESNMPPSYLTIKYQGNNWLTPSFGSPSFNFNISGQIDANGGGLLEVVMLPFLDRAISYKVSCYYVK